MPWLVSVADRVDAPPRVWQWSVDPLTRRVEVPASDTQEIQAELDRADVVVAHHGKFDAHMLANVGVEFPWHKLCDTLEASHLLASNHRHSLDATVGEHLGVDITPFERAVAETTKACLQSIRRGDWAKYGVDCQQWRLAKDGLPEMPSVGGSDDEDKPWKSDMWIVYSLAEALQQQGIEPTEVGVLQAWLDAPRAYAEADPVVTLAMWLFAEREVAERGYARVLAERMKLPRVAYDLERHGATISETATNGLIAEYSESVDAAQAGCMAVADRFDFPLVLPDGAAPNDSIREFMWGSVHLQCPKCGEDRVHKHWDGPVNGQANCPRCAKKKGRSVYQKDWRGKVQKHLPKVLVGGPEQVECVSIENPCLSLTPIISGKTGRPTLDSAAMEQYRTTLGSGPALEFVEHLLGMRSRQTAVSYMRSYSRYWLPTGVNGWYRIHSHANPTATDTLRWGFSDPNTSNISDKEDFSLRRCFGPAPDREWWKMDFKSIERRIPTYESKEPKMVEVFEHSGEPYWGNLYNLTASVLYPNEYWPCASVEGLFRREHPMLYKRAKFFDLARQYGCGKRKGDLLSGVTGSTDLMSSEFPLLAALQQYYLDFANQHGYVETIPDREVDPTRGYPILAARGEDGRVSPTTPFCYHVSGTAMQCTNRAMVKTEEQVREWRAGGWDGFLTLQIHDELVFDVPYLENKGNLPKMLILKGLVESVGNGIGIPTPVSLEYHTVDYSKGEVIP